MSFTYDLATDIGRIRLRLNDTTEGAGVKPDGTNLSDEEIQSLLDDEDGNVMRGLAACCEVLAMAWSALADTTVGQRQESLSQVAKAFTARAQALRDQHGYTAAAAGFGIVLGRDDGYRNYALTGSDTPTFEPEYT